ncbi:NADP-dependent oxidoreductase [Thalassobaculum fulvum]|uniref:NADP-dependent oxidoreductase n=1 Tax=Thalassobaculum fulvum TaxID=1633335 RepID=A0A918XPZ5_9PROT|nr:NADP-dependent oxidoreductase [Thalassobaculum fulvum]GHD46125.1 NADP-dependent oxidoreductase [Thalassobaculum fulvum]
MKSLQVRFVKRPTGEPTADTFEIGEAELPALGDGEILVRIIWLSLDPYMRGRMDDKRSYAQPQALGAVMQGGTVGQVVESRNPKFAEGDFVLGMFGWQSHAVSDGAMVRKLDPAVAPLSTWVGVMGMPGLTAYIGLLDVGEMKAGDTVAVSAASGAVGSVVGQLARIKGAKKVVGIAGAEEKCRFVVDELGFDACVSHRSASLRDDLKAACPDGIDIYFENVGGPTLDAALSLMNPFGRIPVCGMISMYNTGPSTEGPDRLPSLMRRVLTDRLKIQGFIVSDRAAQHQKAFIEEVGGYIRDGRIKYREFVTEGLENAPRAFAGLLRGENFGKQLVKVSDDPTLG